MVHWLRCNRQQSGTRRELAFFFKIHDALIEMGQC